MSNTSKLYLVIFVIIGLACANLYMHSPLELRDEGVRFFNYHENPESLSRDTLSYLPNWYDNPTIMYHNFYRILFFIDKNISNNYSNQIIFILYELIFLISIYLVGHELSEDRLYALVPCFIYFFGFVLPDMQGQFHDPEVTEKHLAMSLVTLSLCLYLLNRKTVAYIISALLCYIHIKTGYTWGTIIIILTLKDLYQEKLHAGLVQRILLAGFFLMPLFIMNIPAYMQYDFSWLPESFQYELQNNGPGGRSIKNLLTLYGWNKLGGGIFGVVNGFLLLWHFKDEKHMGTLGLIFTASLLLGVAWGIIHDFYGYTFISKLYPLGVLSYVTLINFFLLAVLFINSFKKSAELVNSVICYYLILLIPFYQSHTHDMFIQFTFFVLIIIKINHDIKYINLDSVGEKKCILGLSALLVYYMLFARTPHWVARWAEIFYVSVLLIVPMVFHWLENKRRFVSRKHYNPIFITVVIGLVALSSVYGHIRASGRYDVLAQEIEISEYIRKHTDKNAAILYYTNYDWEATKRLTTRWPFNARLLGYNSKVIYPELVKRAQIMCEDKALEKYYQFRLKGNSEKAEAYLNAFWKSMTKEKLYKIKEHYPIDYIIRKVGNPIQDLDILYKNKKYIVYKVN